MRVLLINPPRYRGMPVIREDRCEIVNRYLLAPPYSLMQIAAVLRENQLDVRLIDANCEDLSEHEMAEQIAVVCPDILVFRFTPTTIGQDMLPATIAKSLNRNVVTVGLCWSLKAHAEAILREKTCLDIYLTGDYGTYEYACLQLAKAASDGRDWSTVGGVAFRRGARVISTEPSIVQLDDLPMPAYELIPPLSKYHISPKHGSHLPFTVMYTSQGCPHKCIFCTVGGTRWQGRSVESIVKEITYAKDTYGLKCIFFLDELFTMNRDRTLELCQRMVDSKFGLTWYCSTRADRVDRELLRTMRAAGCRAISFGIESGSQTILDSALKGLNLEQAKEAIRMAKDAGIKTHAAFIIGLPGENWSTVRQTINFVRETLPTMAQFNVAIPYPGTKLHEMASQRGWLHNGFNWTELCHHKSVMRTDEMTSKEIETARKKAYRSFYFNVPWILDNMKHTLQDPDDVWLLVQYYAKSLKNYFVHKMKHAH